MKIKNRASTKLLSLLLVLAMCFSMMPLTATAADLQTNAAGAFLLYTSDDLKAFADYVNGGNYDADAVLMDNITYEGAASIGTADITRKDYDDGYTVSNIKGYSGVFEGNGYTITLPVDTYLFGAIDGATVKNLTVSGGNKAIVAYMASGTVLLCKNNSTISGWAYCGSIADIVGADSSTSVSDAVCVIRGCVNYGNLNVNWNVGGIVGAARGKNVLIDNCANYGNFNLGTGRYVGGIAGKLADGATVSYCFDSSTRSRVFSGNYGIAYLSNSTISNSFYVNGGTQTGATQVSGLTDDVLNILNQNTSGIKWNKDGTPSDRWNITFDANGGSGIMENDYAVSDYTLPKCNFDAPYGYKFSGWATTAEGTVISEAAITVTDDITLYAIWEKIPADAPTVEAGNNLTLTYKGYTDEQVSVSVTKKDGYTYTYQWYDSSKQLISGATDSTYPVPNDLTVGSYDYYCVVTAKRNDNDDTALAESKSTVTVNKATQNAPSGIVEVAETISGKQDGKITDVNSTMEYRKDGKTTYTDITGNTVENLAAGKYYVRVKGDDNHNPSDETEVIIAKGGKLAVTVPQNQIGYTLTADKAELDWHGSTTLVFELADGYSKTDEFSVSATGATLTDNGNGTYTISNAEDNVIVTVRGVADTTTPEAEISISTNKWTDFLNNITFGLFFKETETVTITATDKGSGVDEIYYLISETVLDEDSVETLVNDFWTKYDATNKPSISPDRECIVYVKVIDKAQNVKYISSDGLVFDGTAPVISGIENGKTYYGQVVFGVTDGLAGMLKVEIDGVDKTHFEGQYVINPDNKEHTIVATDNAGNKTEYKITVYKNYTVTYKIDGENVSTQTVGHGKDATAPAIPEKEGYTQTAPTWDKDGKNITADTEINAVYTINEYTITFMDEKGVYKTLTYKHGEKVTMPEVPTKDGYTVKWEATIDKATGNATIKAVYTEIPATDKPSSPQTGDNSNMALWFVLLFISGGTTITLTVYDRKKRAAQK